MDDVQQLLTIIDQAYDKKSWHGTNLRGSIRGVSAAEAAWRPAPQPPQHLGNRGARGVLEVRRDAAVL